MAQRTGHVRIGELSRRSGVSNELLRAWERRYGLLHPMRSENGYRLYSADDERRVAVMREHLARGLSAAEAARLALDETGGEAPPLDTPVLGRGVQQLRAALDGLDEVGAHAALDRLLAELSLETVLRGAVLPYLRELGERWERGDASIGQEHFASGVLRGRLLGLARGWGQGGGPHAVLACAPGELHELGLIVFGLALRERNWRITYLGPDTPLATVEEIAEALRPDAVVIAATTAAYLEGERSTLARLGRAFPVWLAGPGADDQLAGKVHATLLDVEPLAAAQRVAAAR
jgi:DNA-binding transcriptional MerR regulator